MSARCRIRIEYIKFSIWLIALCFCSCTDIESKKNDISVWAESMYLRGYKPSTGYKVLDRDVVAFARRLKRYGIRYVYLFAGPFQEDGSLPTYPFTTEAKNRLNILRRFNNELVILPWVGGIQHRSIHLEDSLWVANALESCRELVDYLEVEGLHVDFEYLIPGDKYLERLIKSDYTVTPEEYENYVTDFHRKLRKIKTVNYISSVVVSTSPRAMHWKHQTSIAALDLLSSYIDQLSFLFYDTKIQDSTSFRDAAYDLVSDIQYLKSNHRDVDYLIAIGTFINEPPLQKYRNLNIESIEHTIESIYSAEAFYSAGTIGGIVDGIAVYCDWETSDSEYNRILFALEKR